MQRVTRSPRARNEKGQRSLILFRPSLAEVLVAVLLETVATCGIMLGPAIAAGHAAIWGWT